MKALSAMKKEMLEVLHDRAMLAVLVAFPVFVMLFLGNSFRSMEINGLPVGLAGPENVSSSPLFAGLNQSQAFKLEGFASEDDAMTAFRNGRLRAVIIVPQDLEDALARGNGSTIRIVVDNSDLALEQAVVAAMSSVIEASSADITKGYVTAAWKELEGLNSSASSLSSGIASTKAGLQETRIALNGTTAEMEALDVGMLEGSLDNASADIAGMQALLLAQKADLEAMGAENEALLNKTDAFLVNASSALNKSISTVSTTHARLRNQTAQMNLTILSLSASISGLEAIKAATPDPTVIAALDLNIASLTSMRNTVQGQLADTQAQMAELESLNATLHSFRLALGNYSLELNAARAGMSDTSALTAALDSASMALSDVNASFSSARTEVAKLRSLLSNMKDTTSQIGTTLDGALEQTEDVESLIGSLQGTVAEQTGKDPDVIASPLSVKVENQYERGSFVDFIMPQVMAISLLFSCFLLGSISVVREKTGKTIIRALLAPGALANLVLGKIAVLMLLSFGQVALILAVALALFGVEPPANLVVLVWGTAISSLVLSSIGILVGFFTRTESAAIQGCLLLAIPMLFLGNIIFSPDLLPAYTQILQQLLPLAHVTSIFKIVLITDGDPAGDVAALISYFVLLAILMAYVVLRRREITHYL